LPGRRPRTGWLYLTQTSELSAQGLKPSLILTLRGAEAPLFHGFPR
jgi:hypothetical protein